MGDTENKKLKMQQQQDQESGGFGVGTVRDIGDDGEMTEDQAAADELPEEAPISIIYKMATNDGDDNEDEQEDEVVMDDDDGGFDMDGGLGGLSLGGGGGDDDKEELGPAAVYNPAKLCMTTFNCTEDATTTLKNLKTILDELDVTYSSDGYSFNCSAATMKGKITYIASVFKKDKDSDVSVVEIRRGKGGYDVFRQQYATLRNKMEAYAEKQAIKEIGEDDEKEEVQAPVEKKE